MGLGIRFISCAYKVAHLLDIDECASNHDNCADNSTVTCVNAEGSYLCFCNFGYFGDGKACIGKLYKILMKLYVIRHIDDGLQTNFKN